MVRSRELVSRMALLAGLPAGAVEYHWRALAKAGLVTSAGRGAAAPHMKPGDAAMLLLSVAASPSPTTGAAAAPALAETIVGPAAQNAVALEGLDLGSVRIHIGSTLQEVLSGLIAEFQELKPDSDSPLAQCMSCDIASCRNCELRVLADAPAANLKLPDGNTLVFAISAENLMKPRAIPEAALRRESVLPLSELAALAAFLAER